jgi:protein-disulfide isomerase
VRSGVNGTPTFFINNRRYGGPPDYEPLVATIAAQLESASMPA